jgi:ferredoxin
VELLLSEHVGDCDGPCEVACPAGMDAPRMLRAIMAGDWDAAAATALESLVLPGVLGRICPAPCEKACRRAQWDAAVTIRGLHGQAARRGSVEADAGEATGRSVAVVGAGPAGLAAAWELRRVGHAAIVYDDHDRPGGALRYQIARELLPEDLLDADLARIERLGMEFRGGVRVGADVSLDDLRGRHDAVILACGGGGPELPGLDRTGTGIAADRETQQTSLPEVFAAGDAVRPARMAVRAVADGRAAARSVALLLAGAAIAPPPRRFNSRMGRLLEGEIERMVEAAEPSGRVETPLDAALTDEHARIAAARCLHCDCLAADDCRLREAAEALGARQRLARPRRPFEPDRSHPRVLHEPGKCIACGLCVAVAEEAGEPLGMTFLGRGYGVRVAGPFGEPLAEALTRSAERAARVCPTGALAIRD